MTKVASLDVQLVGHTVFTPPVDEDGETRLFTPDGDNYDGISDGVVQFNGQALAEFSGRLCYWSFDRPNPKTARHADYMLNILSQKHGSVLEHASVSFLLQGVSRSLTHELVRHRHFSFSQLSQRYVDSSELSIVVPPVIGDAGSAPLDIVASTLSGAYVQIVTALMGNGLKRKQAREAARAVLPNMTETKIVVTGNYRAWIEFLVKRDNPAADAEIQRLAREIGVQLAAHAPNVFGVAARAVWDESAAQEPAREVKV